MINAILPIVVALVGLLIYVLTAKAEAKEIGRLLFFAGAFWAVYLSSRHVFHF